MKNTIYKEVTEKMISELKSSYQEVLLSDVATNWAEDQRHWRFIISPEDGGK